MESFSIVALLLVFIGALAALIKGSDWLIDESSALARYFGVSELLIGLTVVAIGTSLPEFAVTFTSSATGNGSLALGNVIGSNITNIALVFGLTTLIYTTNVKKIPGFDIAMSAGLIVVFSALTYFDLGFPIGSSKTLSQFSGFVLLGCFLFFLIRMFISSRSPSLQEREKEAINLARSVFMIILGLLFIYFGGKYTVESGIQLATFFQIPQEIIGLTAIAVGTSLPELVAGIAAASKGRSELLVGNIIGSNIFNMSLVLGSGLSVKPIEPYLNLYDDISWLAGFTFLFAALLWIKRKQFTRPLGGLFLLSYFIYLFELTGR